MEFPSLFKQDAHNKEIEWKIWVENDTIYVVHGVVGGKMYEPTTKVCKAANVGKINEKSSNEQALFVADSKWRQQIVKGYKPKNDDKKGQEFLKNVMKDVKDHHGTMHKTKTKDSSINQYILGTFERKIKPMKCHEFIQHKSKIKWNELPYAQAKYDGVRCIASIEQGQGVMTTSSGKQFVFLQHIKKALEKVLVGEFEKLVLDGECYVHFIKGIDTEQRFNEITGACRSVRSEPHPLEHLMKLHVFDIIDDKLSQEERFAILDQLFTTVRVNETPIVAVPRWVVKNEEQVYKLQDQLFSKNYEGVIIRNRYGKYVQQRSSDIQKYKVFFDEECTIIGADKSENGCVVWICKYSNGEIFNCDSCGTVEKRKEMFLNCEKYIGKQLTVKYQSLTKKGGVPRFGKGKGIRDYE